MFPQQRQFQASRCPTHTKGRKSFAVLRRRTGHLLFRLTSGGVAAGDPRAAAGRRGRIILLAALLLSTSAFARTTSTSQADLIRHLIASVVNISARVARTAPSDAPAADAAPANSEPKVSVSAGSGFVIDKSGLIATNWHVLDGAFDVVVTFADGT